MAAEADKIPKLGFSIEHNLRIGMEFLAWSQKVSRKNSKFQYIDLTEVHNKLYNQLDIAI